jgi:hypothetical protein
MKKRKNSRRNLLVRFIRWIYKSLDTLFKRKKSTFRSLDRRRISTQERDILPRSAPVADRTNERDISPRSASVADRTNERDISPSLTSVADRTNERDISPSLAPVADRRTNEQLITVGELFARVQWQFPEENIPATVLNLNSIPRPHDVSRN